MSTPPQEADRRTVDLSREQRWVVHHTLVHRADEYIDEDRTVPAWLIRLLETIEADGETMTVRQGRNLATLLQDDGLEPVGAADDDLETVVDELESALR
ncbi:hypothetical protein ACLI4Y_10865 [Natrialbaceae archaeon A-CW3]